MDIVPVPTKAGVTTSEFYVHLIAIVGGLVVQVLPQSSPITQALGLLLTLGSTMNYGWIRQNGKNLAIQAGLAALKVVSDAAKTAGDTTSTVKSTTTVEVVPNSSTPSVAPQPASSAK